MKPKRIHIYIDNYDCKVDTVLVLAIQQLLDKWQYEMYCSKTAKKSKIHHLAFESVIP